MNTEETIAEFETKLAACETDDDRCDTYWRVFFRLTNINLLLAKKYADEFFLLASKVATVKLLANAHYLFGFYYSLSKQYPNAQHELSLCLDLIRPLKLTAFEAQLHNLLGINYNATSLYLDAIDSYSHSIELWSNVGNSIMVNEMTHNLAMAYERAGLKQKSLDLRMNLISGGYDNELLFLTLANFFKDEENDFDKAELYFTKCKENIKGTTDTQHLIYFHSSFADLLVKRNKYSEAKENLDKARSISESYSNDSVSATELLKVEASYYEAIGEWDNAHNCLLKLLESVEKNNLKEEIADAYHRLKYLHETKRDHQLALTYANKYIAIEKEIKIEQTSNIQKVLDVKQKFSEAQKEKEITEAKNKELEEKNIIIAEERDRGETLLLNILPAEVAEELKAKGFADAKHFNDVTVLFTDFVGFTSVSEQLTPQQLVNELHACFKAFDEIIQKYNIEKIKTVGDAYLAVCGLPVADEAHAENILKAAMWK
jgi:adenylate cyclase